MVTGNWVSEEPSLNLLFYAEEEKTNHRVRPAESHWATRPIWPFFYIPHSAWASLHFSEPTATRFVVPLINATRTVRRCWRSRRRREKTYLQWEAPKAGYSSLLPSSHRVTSVHLAMVAHAILASLVRKLTDSGEWKQGSYTICYCFMGVKF